jgi:hypothetical protein
MISLKIPEAGDGRKTAVRSAHRDHDAERVRSLGTRCALGQGVGPRTQLPDRGRVGDLSPCLTAIHRHKGGSSKRGCSPRPRPRRLRAVRQVLGTDLQLPRSIGEWSSSKVEGGSVSRPDLVTFRTRERFIMFYLNQFVRPDHRSERADFRYRAIGYSERGSRDMPQPERITPRGAPRQSRSPRRSDLGDPERGGRLRETLAGSSGLMTRLRWVGGRPARENRLPDADRMTPASARSTGARTVPG